MIIYRILLILTLTLALENASKSAFAEDSKATAKKPKSSKILITKIRADFIDIKRNDGVVTLRDKVVIEREDLNVLADHMEVFYDDENGRGDDAIKKIIANDHVKIFNGEFVATGDVGTFDPKANNFILEKNVIFNKGASIAHGEKFIYNLKTKKGNLVGQKVLAKDNNPNRDGRVTVIIDDSDLEKSNKK